MGRDRATRVASAPRGLGLYRCAGRDGFFFVKNLAAQAKQYPGKIKKADGLEKTVSATAGAEASVD